MGDPVLTATAATLRYLAECNLDYMGSLLPSMAQAVETLTEENDMCCPVCEETVCDESCPLRPVRDRWQTKTEEEAGA